MEPTRWDHCSKCQRYFERNQSLQFKVRNAEHFEHEGAGWEVADGIMRPYHASGHKRR